MSIEFKKEPIKFIVAYLLSFVVVIIMVVIMSLETIAEFTRECYIFFQKKLLEK